MKYLRINLKSNPGSNEIVYPVGYQAEIGNFAVDHLYYDVDGALKLLLCIPDKDYKDTMVKTDVEVINEVDAKAISEAKETRTETITDEAKIRRLEIKSRMGVAMTADEQKALDPQDPTPGFGVTEILADRVAKLKANEVKQAEMVVK